MPQINLTPLSFATDIIRPGGGPEQWHNSSDRIPYPTESQPRNQENSLEVYYRFQWAKVEGSTKGSYTWGYFDGLARQAIDKGQKLSFGIMTFNGDGGDTSYGGGSSAYPLWLHNEMQAEPNKDWLNGNGVWIPNFNSQKYIAALRSLHQAIRDHLINTTYKPTAGPNAGKTVTLADAIFCIDIRGFGNWGEWHTYDMVDNWNSFPSGRQPSLASLKAIIDAHTQVFDRWPLVMMVAGYDGGATGIPIFAPYPEIAHYALTAKNAWGDVGWRRDQWGARDAYLNTLLEGNNSSFGSSGPFKNIILNKWKTCPETGEPYPGGLDMTDLMRQVMLYRPCSIGNGNFGGYPSSLATRDRIRAAFEACGYKLQIQGGNFTVNGNALSLTLNWLNGGVCPAYEDWNVAIYLKASNGNIAAQTLSSFKPKLFLPNPQASSITDAFVFSVPAGTYTLAIRVIDPKNYRQPMPLFNAGMQPDGTYNLGTVVTGTTPPLPNIGPTVNAGSDVVITLPINTVTLVGSASDTDGEIKTLLWEKVSGSGTLATPDKATTFITGLTEGVSVFKLTGTDDDNASNSDQVTVTVKPKPVDPPPTPVTVVNVTNQSTVTTVTTVHYSDGSTEKFPK